MEDDLHLSIERICVALIEENEGTLEERQRAIAKRVTEAQWRALGSS